MSFRKMIIERIIKSEKEELNGKMKEERNGKCMVGKDRDDKMKY